MYPKINHLKAAFASIHQSIKFNHACKFSLTSISGTSVGLISTVKLGSIGSGGSVKVAFSLVFVCSVTAASFPLWYNATVAFDGMPMLASREEKAVGIEGGSDVKDGVIGW